MRILNVVARIDKKSGGGSVAALELARVFSASGFDVDNWIIVDGTDGDLLDVAGLKARFFKTNYGSSRFRFSLDFARAVRKNIKNYDVVILSGLYLFPNTISAHSCRRNNVPYILLPYDSFNPEKLQHHGLQKKIYRILLDDNMVRGAMLIQAANEAERRQVVDYTKRLNNVFVAAYGFHVGEFSRARDKSLFEKLVPWNVEDKKTILYLARVAKTKGVETLIDAYEKIVLDSDDYRLLIVGPAWDKSYDEYLRERCRELVINNKIYFAGMVTDDEKYACFQGSFLYVLPSYSENFGITVLEAIANGLVAIVTDNVPWEELEISKAGYRVQTRNAQAIYEAIMEYSSLSEVQRCNMKNNARELSLKYDYASVAEAYSKAIEKASKK